jgi:hypothetical protein
VEFISVIVWWPSYPVCLVFKFSTDVYSRFCVVCSDVCDVLYIAHELESSYTRLELKKMIDMSRLSSFVRSLLLPYIVVLISLLLERPSCR